ncbi:MAG: class I SAM-dependent methyltransferase [Verrucomicrobiota bacterium]
MLAHVIKMNRIVKPELLDTLPPDDPRAVRSRRDLRRVNGWMRNHSIMGDALRNQFENRSPREITELGAGDGDFLLRVAQKLSPQWPNVKLALLDLQRNVSAETLAAFAAQGLPAEVVVADVFAWPQTTGRSEIVIANLFLHHFEDARLAGLLRQIAGRATVFVALEPRRALWPLFSSRLLWAIGCNAVTRHDAVVSVRAGFTGRELSALWPDKQNWHLTERPAGAFSHLFIAQKRAAGILPSENLSADKMSAAR